jgi:hypothetical protein
LVIRNPKENNMNQIKRTSVFVAPQGTIGQELVFRHYTSKVVAALHPGTKKVNGGRHSRKEIIGLKDANSFAFQVMKNSGLAAIYETCLKRSEADYKKALSAYFERNKK